MNIYMHLVSEGWCSYTTMRTFSLSPLTMSCFFESNSSISQIASKEIAVMRVKQTGKGTRILTTDVTTGQPLSPLSGQKSDCIPSQFRRFGQESMREGRHAESHVGGNASGVDCVRQKPFMTMIDL